MPGFTLWKNTDTKADGYVTGLEPGTGFPYNRSVERANGRVPKLKAGASVTFKLEVEVLGSSVAVKKVKAAIAKIQGDKITKVNNTPPKAATPAP